MNWHEKRESFNDKGLCAREACQKPFGETPYFNSGSNLYYCESCAKSINFYTPGLCTPVETIRIITSRGE